MKSEVLFALWDALKSNNIEIPFPQRDLRLKTPVAAPARAWLSPALALEKRNALAASVRRAAPDPRQARVGPPSNSSRVRVSAASVPLLGQNSSPTRPR